MPRTRKLAAVPTAEHDADPKVAAAAVDAPMAEKAKAPRTDEKVIKRAIALRKQNLGIVAIANKLTEEGHRSATGKELRPQTVRQLLIRAEAWTERPKNDEELRPAAETK